MSVVGDTQPQGDKPKDDKPKKPKKKGDGIPWVLVIAIAIGVAFVAIYFAKKNVPQEIEGWGPDDFPTGDELDDYEHGVGILKKWLEGDITFGNFLEGVENYAKLISSAAIGLAKKPTVPGFYKDPDPSCLPKEKHYYRTYDGSCNWIKNGEAELGKAGQPFGRDTPGHYYADGYNKPREGPSAREVSNAFFNITENKQKFWMHSQFLIGFVEFLVHDLLDSVSGHEKGDVYNIPIPKCDPYFDPQCKGDENMPFWRNKKINGTGTDKANPREIVNNATIWIDLGMVYGWSKEQNAKLRTHKDGKLILDEEGYLPINDERFNFDMIWRKNKTDVFVAGDHRANQDFLLQTWQTIWAREHNRMCDTLIDRYPDWDDETLFLAARTVTACKFSMVGNAYFIAYFYDTMPAPANPVSIYSMYQGVQFTSPVQTYPWAGANNPETHRPDPLPNEFAVEYRWHDLIPDHFINPATQEKVDLVETAWSASDFKKIGINNIITAMSNTSIPDFHSGLSDGYRNVKFSFRDPEEGSNFDLVAWAIEHERERGIPTFNTWARNYKGKVIVKPRKTFEEFTTNPLFVERLKKLYKTPDDVDLYVGQALDETQWPHTHIPTAMLAVSFYTLFKGGATDRFALNYQLAHCLVEQKPWNCRPNNILQELLWKPVKGRDNWRIPDTFWLKELDVINQGTNMLRRVVSQNTPLKCLPKNLFFLADPDKNPITCYDLSECPGPKYDKVHKTYQAIKMLSHYGKFGPFKDLTDKYGPVLRVGVANRNIVLLNRINDFDSVFGSGEMANWIQRDWPDYIYQTYGRLAGYKNGERGVGLSNAGGETWKRHRWVHDTYVIPAFHTHFPTINRHAQMLVDGFYQNEPPKAWAPFHLINRNYQNFMAELSYSREYLDADIAKKEKLFEAYQSWLDGWNTAFPRKTKERNELLDFVHEWTMDLVAQKKSSGNYGTDWIGIYLSKPSYDGKVIDERSAIVIPFDYAVGNGGSGVFALNFALWTLAKHPDIQERLYKEIIATVGQGEISSTKLHEMKYLLATARESLRYFPPGGHVGGGRMSMGTTVVEGYQVPPNTTVLLESYLIQRNRRYWGEDADTFNPERFLKPRPNPDYAFATFGAGRMGCAGTQLAPLQLAVNIAYIIRAFKLQKTDDIVVDTEYVKKYYKMTAFETQKKHPEIIAYPRGPPTKAK